MIGVVAMFAWVVVGDALSRDRISVELELDKATYRVGEPVRLRTVVRNVGFEPVLGHFVMHGGAPEWQVEYGRDGRETQLLRPVLREAVATGIATRFPKTLRPAEVAEGQLLVASDPATGILILDVPGTYRFRAYFRDPANGHNEPVPSNEVTVTAHSAGEEEAAFGRYIGGRLYWIAQFDPTAGLGPYPDDNSISNAIAYVGEYPKSTYGVAVRRGLHLLLGLRYRDGIISDDEQGRAYRRLSHAERRRQRLGEIGSWLKRIDEACESGVAVHCWNLAQEYQRLDMDTIKMRRLLERSCSGGLLAGCRELGTIYASGVWVVRDPSKAREFWNLACKGGRQDACDLLATEQRGLPAGKLDADGKGPKGRVRGVLLGDDNKPAGGVGVVLCELSEERKRTHTRFPSERIRLASPGKRSGFLWVGATEEVSVIPGSIPPVSTDASGAFVFENVPTGAFAVSPVLEGTVPPDTCRIGVETDAGLPLRIEVSGIGVKDVGSVKIGRDPDLF